MPSQQWDIILKVCVLGAGIVGLATAWELNRKGYDVVVVDSGLPGSGASGGNGAQLSYSYVAPLADATIWKNLPALLLSPSSPLKIRPQLDPLQWRWGLSFLAACNERTAHDTTATLLTLAGESRAVFETMLDDVSPNCDYKAAGKLVIYRSAEALSAAGRQVALQAGLGGRPQRVVTKHECLAIEPALAVGESDDLAGGVFTESESAADCLKLCEELARVLTTRGVEVLTGRRVTRFELKGQRAEGVVTGEGFLAADAFVLSCGAGSVGLGRQLGVSLQIYPMKGYSITPDLDGAPQAGPKVSVTDSARKTVFARIGDRLRVAGMAELVGNDRTIPPKRIETLVQTTKVIFPGCSRFETLRPWTGMRPATPTGIPIVGRRGKAPANVVFNTGHGGLGFTLAFGSARAVGHALAAMD